MTSQTEIVNRALQLLGEPPVLSIEDDTPSAQEMRTAYRPVLRAALRAHPWNFAMKRASLAPSATPPAFGRQYSYPLPVDCLRALQGEDDRDWQMEGRSILADDGPVLEIRYIAEIDNETLYDPLFSEYFSAELALQTMEAVTGSRSRQDMAERSAERAIRQAKRTNAIELPEQTPPVDDWLLARY